MSRRRRPGLPFSFWLMIIFGLICIVSGAVVGLLGPRLFPPRPAASIASGEPGRAHAEPHAPD